MSTSVSKVKKKGCECQHPQTEGEQTERAEIWKYNIAEEVKSKAKQ